MNTPRIRAEISLRAASQANHQLSHGSESYFLMQGSACTHSQNGDRPGTIRLKKLCSIHRCALRRCYITEHRRATTKVRRCSSDRVAIICPQTRLFVFQVAHLARLLRVTTGSPWQQTDRKMTTILQKFDFTNLSPILLVSHPELSSVELSR